MDTEDDNAAADGIGHLLDRIPSIWSVLAVEIPISLRARIDAIDAEDYFGVIRKVREHALETTGRDVSDEELRAGILALKQYYVVPVLDPANAHALSAALDPYWHAHILHTEAYMAFCERVVGGYMHHRPLDHASAHDVAGVRRLYAYTIRVFGVLFNKTDPRFWPQALQDKDLVCAHANDLRYQPDSSLWFFEPSAEGKNPY